MDVKRETCTFCDAPSAGRVRCACGWSRPLCGGCARVACSGGGGSPFVLHVYNLHRAICNAAPERPKFEAEVVTMMKRPIALGYDP